MSPRDVPAAVLWDLDGTLVDTEPYWIECEFELVEEYGGSWSIEHAHALVGNPLLVSADYIQRHGSVPLPLPQIVDRLLAGVIERVHRRVPWRPGARELVLDLFAAEVPCALVTMSYRNLAQAVLANLPAAAFPVVVAGDEVTHGKPHPEPYLRAAELLQVEPAQCVAIEDSPTGVSSALAAGVPTLGVQHLVPLAPAPGLRVLTTLVDCRAADLRSLAPARTS